jgi:hypothetical protein
MLTIVPCPDCGVPAEITDCCTLPSTDGPVVHVALSCLAGHHFRMAADMLAGRPRIAATGRPPRTAPAPGRP